MQNERVFVQLERSKREQTILYRASQSLGAALDEEAVIDAGLSAAAEIAPYDFASISFYDPDERRHTIRRAVGLYADEFESLTFRDNTSLTAMAVKNRHYLPYRGDFDPRQQTVYTRRANLRGMESLLILPLIVREDAIGTVAFAARRADAFGDSVRPTLQVLANQLAVSLSNAQAVRRLEQMATTDGLTGCLNKRAFLEELERKLRSAERFGRTLSLLVTDIDHFKSVNDTYGHATGDVVIKELGHILQRCKARDRHRRPLRRRGVLRPVRGDRHGGRRAPRRAHPGGAGGDRVQDRDRSAPRHRQPRRRDLPEGREHVPRAVRGERQGALRLEARRPEPGPDGLIGFGDHDSPGRSHSDLTPTNPSATSRGGEP